jgi:hypothetical protein
MIDQVDLQTGLQEQNNKTLEYLTIIEIYQTSIMSVSIHRNIETAEERYISIIEENIGRRLDSYEKEEALEAGYYQNRNGDFEYVLHWGIVY